MLDSWPLNQSGSAEIDAYISLQTQLTDEVVESIKLTQAWQLDRQIYMINQPSWQVLDRVSETRGTEPLAYY